ncbi:MAG: flagellar filament capping protein FliD [Luteibacter sp.]
MATTTTVGSSAIDVTSIVSSLVAAKRKAPDAAIAANTATTNTQISALGNFTSSLTSLQSAIKSLTDGTAFKSQKSSVGDSTVLGASADSTAVSGTYDVVVSALATAQKVTSGVFSSSKAAVGTGTLTLSVGDKSMSLTLDSSNNSLENIRDAINKSTDNPGVSAAIVTGSDGAHIVLTSTATGASNAFTVSSSGGDGGLAALNFDPATGTATTKAVDAQFTVDGLAATSPSNTVASALDGITLSLAKVGSSSVTITTDQSAATTAVTNLVTAYNNFVSTYQSLTKYDATGNSVGALIGDATINSIKSQVTNILNANASDGSGSKYNSLSDLGLAFQTDGTIKLDSAKLTNALASDPRRVQNLFSGTNGVAVKLDSVISNWTGTQGILTQRTSNLNKRLQDYQDQTTKLDTSMDAYQTRLTKQYSALDAMMTKLNSTSDFLTQQFDALTKKS